MLKCSALITAMIVIIVIIAIASIAIPTAAHTNDVLTGMWVADPSFLVRSNLADVQLYLGPESGGRRQGYLIMVDGNKNLIANQAIEMTSGGGDLRQSFANHFRARPRFVTEATIDYDGVGGSTQSSVSTSPPIPSDIRLTLHPLEGSLAIHDGQKLYAFLWRDGAASSAAEAAAAADDTAAEAAADDTAAKAAADDTAAKAAADDTAADDTVAGKEG